MSTDHLLSIGGFAIVSGLSITALRHYDEVGILLPACVDPVTGYRRYRPEQVEQARLIRALRQLEMPVESSGSAYSLRMSIQHISGRSMPGRTRYTRPSSGRGSRDRPACSTRAATTSTSIRAEPQEPPLGRKAADPES
ncbi:MerR family transcriptional regulator [Rhizomonospora bruguierae]|nr:MerR family transcriptional regulator [Micromonospora sp. NBRC 107566]